MRRKKKNDISYSSFTREQICFIEKYPRLYDVCVVNGVPYSVVNRCVLRWLQYYKKHNLPSYYPKNIEETCICIRVFIAAYNAEITPDIIEELTKAKLAYELAEVTGFKTWFEWLRG